MGDWGTWRMVFQLNDIDIHIISLINRMKNILLSVIVFVFVLPCLTLNAQEKIKVACIGNSVTFGAGLEDKESAYPVQLEKLLGEVYEVSNFGQSGATLLEKGHRPYVG